MQPVETRRVVHAVTLRVSDARRADSTTPRRTARCGRDRPVSSDIATEALHHLREICLALPEVTERPSHSAPTFFVRDKKSFVQLWADGHHSDTFPHLWCAAPPGAQEELVEQEPERFFRPPYVGHRGWLGVRLDRKVDWNEVAEICRDAYRTVAPKTLVARLDG
jgi:hypothetical protein